jgi:hypothetical protein
MHIGVLRLYDIFDDGAQPAIDNENSLQMTLRPNGGLHIEAWLGGESEIRITYSYCTNFYFLRRLEIYFLEADDPLG